MKLGEDPIYQKIRDKVKKGFETFEDEIEYFYSLTYLSKDTHLETLKADWTILRHKYHDKIDLEIGKYLIEQRWGIIKEWLPCDYCNLNGDVELVSESEKFKSFKCSGCNKGWGRQIHEPKAKPKHEPLIKPVPKRKKKKGRKIPSMTRGTARGQNTEDS